MGGNVETMQWHYIMNHDGDEYCRREREYESWKCDGWAQMTKIHQEIMTANPTPTSPGEIMQLSCFCLSNKSIEAEYLLRVSGISEGVSQNHFQNHFQIK